ncbi:MAG: DUF262 domain-containing protein [Nocardiopsaceae bacterium]|nr:DUF262 domain-containing protein [Nocardiopsaceae bacterium]
MRDREHRPAAELIARLASQVIRGKIRLPRFQREFAWNKQQVLDLMDSIFRNYPIGSLILWESSASLASEIDIAGLRVEPRHDDGDTIYLLDGCQRLSAICGALYWQPDGDPDSYWNLVYDLEEERFLHRADLDEPPARQVPLRLVSHSKYSEFLRWTRGLPDRLLERAVDLHERFGEYEVPVVTLRATGLSEIGRIFQRVNSRGTPLTTMELVRAATWTPDLDLLAEIDRIRGALARKRYGGVPPMILLRAISAAAGHGFATKGIERLAEADHQRLRTAIAETEEAARLAVDFLATEIGVPAAEALPYVNQLAVAIEIFRQVRRPTSAQCAAIRSWFWRTALTGYFEGWNATKMAADLDAIGRFAGGADAIEVSTDALAARLWSTVTHQRGSARTRALGLMLAASGSLDLRTGNRIDADGALARANEMQFHHFFPKNWLMSQGVPGQRANVLANIVLMTADSNRAIDDRPPSAYLAAEMKTCAKTEMRERLKASCISEDGFDAAMSDDYELFVGIRSEALLEWADKLCAGEHPRRPAARDGRGIATDEPAAEIEDTDTDD